MVRGRLWVPLRSSDYRRLWIAQTVSVIGDKVDQIALGILVYEKTGSELQMGVMLAISMLPAALFGMVAGAYVDRWDRRKTMIAADVARAALVAAVPFAVGVGLWLVYLLAFGVALVSLFFEPAKLSLIPDLVGSEELLAANSLDSATVSVAELAGLAFAGGLVAAVGYRAAFFFDALTYLVSGVFVYSIAHRAQARLALGTGWRDALRDAVAGARYVVRHPVLRDLLAIYGVASAGIAGTVTFTYLLALDEFAAGAPGLALLDAAVTSGLLVGSLAVGRSDPAHPARKLLGGLALFSLAFAGTSVAPSISWAVPLLFAAGIANMYFYVPVATLLQTISSADMRGRVFAAKQTTSRILSVAGFVAAGAFAEHAGLSVAILAVSALVALVALAGWTRPALRSA
jgi:MFS family permease